MPSYIDCKNCDEEPHQELKEKLEKLRESNCKTCPGATQDVKKEYIDNLVQNKVRIPSSLYTMNLAVKHSNTSDKINKGIKKHDSYARYLAKRKRNCVCEHL